MEITFKIDGDVVSVKVSTEVGEVWEQSKHKAENLTHEKRWHWDDRESDEYIVATEGHLPYQPTPEDIVCQRETLAQQKAEAEKEIRQLQNRQKILLNRIRGEKRRIRNHRLIQHVLILEGVFPAAIDTDGETIKEFLIEVSLLPGARELAKKMLNAGDEG